MVAEDDARARRIDSYYNESAWELAGMLVDAEDEIALWKDKVKALEFRLAELEG